MATYIALLHMEVGSDFGVTSPTSPTGYPRLAISTASGAALRRSWHCISRA